VNELDKNILDMDEEAQIRIEEIGESDILVGISKESMNIGGK
jgi:hypothetical protein